MTSAVCPGPGHLADSERDLLEAGVDPDLGQLGPSETEVTLTYDWPAVPQLTDNGRFPWSPTSRARGPR